MSVTITDLMRRTSDTSRRIERLLATFERDDDDRLCGSPADQQACTLPPERAGEFCDDPACPAHPPEDAACALCGGGPGDPRHGSRYHGSEVGGQHEYEPLPTRSAAARFAGVASGLAQCEREGISAAELCGDIDVDERRE